MAFIFCFPGLAQPWSLSWLLPKCTSMELLLSLASASFADGALALTALLHQPDLRE